MEIVDRKPTLDPFKSLTDAEKIANGYLLAKATSDGNLQKVMQLIADGADVNGPKCARRAQASTTLLVARPHAPRLILTAATRPHTCVCGGRY